MSSTSRAARAASAPRLSVIRLAAALWVLMLTSHYAAAQQEPALPTPQQQQPYSLPWALRPIIPVSVARLDTVVALYRDLQDDLGVTTVLMPTAGYRITPQLMGIARLGLTGAALPGAAPGAVSVSNPLLGAIYGVRLSNSLRFACFLGGTIPIGSGGDKSADPAAAAANAAGLLARAAMDNAMFAPNDVTVIPGLDLAYVNHRLTVQIEVTFLQLMRVKNEAAQSDRFKTNMTLGLHAGYFLHRLLSAALELRYQRWLAPPAVVSTMENLSLALGPRFHFPLPGGGVLRPSISYSAGLAGTLHDRSYHAIGVDVPYLF